MRNAIEVSQGRARMWGRCVALRTTVLSITVSVVMTSGCSADVADVADVRSAPIWNINVVDRNILVPGQDLRLPIMVYPKNFNPLTAQRSDAYWVLNAATFPRAFVTDSNGNDAVDTNYFASINETNRDPQVITYTINPQAVWSDGAPITWQDIRSQVQALSGSDDSFGAFTTAGYDRVGSVSRGVDERQAILTFDQPYREWRSLFSDPGVLLPQTVTATPRLFQEGAGERPGQSSGPFMVVDHDREKGRILLKRNPKWWGDPPVLDSIDLLTVPYSDHFSALKDERIDAAAIFSDVEVKATERLPSFEVRRAPTTAAWTLYFNGTDGGVLADAALRRAIMRGIDRDFLIKVTQRGLADNPISANNHVFAPGQEGYRDNAGDYGYDIDRANAELEALGWTLQRDGSRWKDGRRLVLTDRYIDSPSEDLMAQLLAEMFSEIGVNLELCELEQQDLNRGVTECGLDIMHFPSYSRTLAAMEMTFGSDGGANFLGADIPGLDEAIAEVLGASTPHESLALADRVDKLLWTEGHSLPIVYVTENIAARRELANFGAFGVADVNFLTVGFTSQIERG